MLSVEMKLEEDMVEVGLLMDVVDDSLSQDMDTSS